MLSMVLSGEKTADDIVLNDIDWYQSNGIRAKLGIRVANIDREARVVIDEEGNRTPYDKLILAMGSSAFIPPISGVEKENVHVFRTLDDTRALLEKSGGQKSRRHRRWSAWTRSRRAACRFAGAKSASSTSRPC